MNMAEQPYNQYEPYTDVVYRLTGYSINHPEDQSYPRFDIYLNVESIHRTYDEAKEKIDALAAQDRSEWSIWYCFYIAEVPLGVECHRDYDGQRRWSFDRRGKPIAHKSISSLEDRKGNREIFWGRDKDDCRFNVGDIVEIPSSRKSITIGIICQMPIDMDFAKSRLPLVKPQKPLSFHLDDSDDNYYVLLLDDDYPDHIDVINCLPAITFHLDDSLVRELQSRLDEFKKEQLRNHRKK